MNVTTSSADALIQAQGLNLHYGAKPVLQDISFCVPKGRVVGLLGHNGAGKTTLMKALLGLALPDAGSHLQVLGMNPASQRVEMLRSVCYIPDVAILPRWATARQLIQLMSGMQPNFSPLRAEALLKRTSIRLDDKVKALSRGMVVQLHLALIAAVDAKLMILDEPTLGLDVLSRKAFYELLLDEWCDGERSVLISTHQVEEVESLLSDVLLLNEGRLALDISLEQLDQRYSVLAHDPAAADAVAAAHPLLRYRLQGGSAALFEGEPPADLAPLGRRMRPSLVDVFVALTRAPDLR